MLNKNTLFRPSKSEAKADNITKIVRGITEADTSAREAKTQRLRAARLERDEADAAQKAASPVEKTRKRAAKAKSAE